MKHAFTVMAAAAISAALTTPALSHERLDRRPCIVASGHGPGVNMDCLVRSSMSQGVFDEHVTLPDGKILVIDGNLNTNTYTLDRRPARKTGPYGTPCYDNGRVRICFQADESDRSSRTGQYGQPRE